MLEFIKEKKNCMGCTACMNICPVGCISMEEDKEGFKYPVADERCIHCNKCESVCPIASLKIEIIPNIKQYAAAAITKDTAVWKASTSGGAFTEICNTFGDKYTVVFGATYNGLKVIHSYVVGVENIGVFRKSKYVQSDLGDSFSKARRFLKEGEKVIFSGTPCQIAGLRSYLDKEYDNLLCIDLICHGVGSPEVFKKSMKNLSEKFNSKIIKYTFRHKKVIMGNFREHVSNYVFDNKKTYCVEIDEYNQLFLSQLCLRNSCQSNCRFRTSNRMGDITIADFKNKIEVYPNMKDYKNYSTIVVNSTKGDDVFRNLKRKMDILSCDLEVVKKYNPLFYRTTYDNPLRDRFFEDFIAGMEIKGLVSKYVPKKNKRRRNVIKDLIPYKIQLWRYRKFKR